MYLPEEKKLNEIRKALYNLKICKSAGVVQYYLSQMKINSIKTTKNIK